jgi:hypothetical protein
MYFPSNNLYAADNTFNISATVVPYIDTIEPSIPGGLIATAVSSNQINITWDSSTDNIAVTGYRIYSEGIFIATSSNASYTDTGLSPATLYSYQVEAFDSRFNFSGLSSTSSATTLPNRRTSGSRQLRSYEENSSLFQVRTYAEKESAVLIWNTKEFARSKVYWGQSTDYEIGTISGVVFHKDHVVRIDNLSQDTQYFYRIELELNNGAVHIFESNFITQKYLNTQILQSTALFAQRKENAILLIWNNVVTESQQVRIVRSDKFFPIDPYDGKVIYQGISESEFKDTTAQEGIVYYYALFVVDQDKMYSAPSVARMSLGKDQKPVLSDSVYSSSYEGILNELNYTNFDFIQKGKKLTFLEDGSTLFAQTATEIRVDGAKIPLGIKTIEITFIPVNGSESSMFLLAYSRDLDSYVGLIPPLESGQVYGIDINILNSFNERVKTIQLVANVESKPQDAISTTNIPLELLSIVNEHKIFSSIVVLFGLIVSFIVRRFYFF